LSLALQAGDLSLRKYYLSLQTHFEQTEPGVLAFLPEEGRFERLQAEAATLAKRFPGLHKRLPLFGLPLGVKDIFHVDGFPTQAGSRLPARKLRGRQADSVSRLKAAGMLVMGKTVTTEFAYFAPGPTRNPHKPAHTPGGSSSGSAAAVAAGLAPLSLGTQTIGSIIRPASFCGVIGYKPSYGRISTEGVIPLAPSFDHVGLFARELAPAKLAASLLVSDWKMAAKTGSKPVLEVPTGDYLAHAGTEIIARFERAVDSLRRAGYLVTQRNPMPRFQDIVERHNLILAAEAAQVHRSWYINYRDRYHEKTAALIERGMAVSSDDLMNARNEARRFSRDLSTIMDIHCIDLWLAPSAPGAAPKGLTSTGDPVMNLPWTQAGFPALNLPMGKNKAGLPLGLQVVADFHRDEDLFAWAEPIATILEELQ
jgi:Asp-tRNA(Asn)/Glu-tRNA(Gln) amidotransferase A subunit family amidase